MEEKKFDLNSLIGFFLIGIIMIWWFYNNQPTQEELKAKQQTEQVKQDSIKNSVVPKTIETKPIIESDSLKLAQTQNELGQFAYSASLPSAKDGETVIENKVLKLVIENKGGYIKEALIKNFVTYDSLPLYLVKDKNASFNINFGTSDNRILNTKDLYFQPTLTKSGENQVLSMKLKVSENKYLEYRYEIKPDEYMVDFSIHSQGLNSSLNTTAPITLDWDLKAHRHEKSIKYENQHTELYYEKEDEKIDYLSMGRDDDATENDVNWVAFKQQFFSSILISKEGFNNAKLTSKELVKNADIDTVFTKAFYLKAPLTLTNGELNYNMQWYIGPTDYQILKKYDRNIKEIVNLGWGI
ncbi:MAG: membrane protein insertase YidC, partial [Lutibacter sp.]